MQQEEFYGYHLASRGKRLVATITEGIIYTFVMIGIYLLFGKSINYYWEQELELIDFPISAITGLIIGAIFYPLLAGNLDHR
jgi:Na+/glutamate symporter